MERNYKTTNKKEFHDFVRGHDRPLAVEILSNDDPPVTLYRSGDGRTVGKIIYNERSATTQGKKNEYRLYV
jgi:hypothetical protein